MLWKVLSPVDADRRDRRHHDQAQARCLGGAVGRAWLAYGPFGGRSRTQLEHDRRRGGRLSEHHGPSGIHIRRPRRHILFRPGLVRAHPPQAGVRLRAGHKGAKAARLFGEGGTLVAELARVPVAS